MADLTPDQRARLLRTFLAMDPDALTDTGFLPPDWERFTYEGRVTLDGLIEVAFVLTCLLYGPYMRIEAETESDDD
jgi:hypothetical protein